MANGDILIGTTVMPSQARILSHGTKIFNDGFECGEKAAEERIIKLLDALATQEPPFAQMLINNLKTLIKGEQK